MRLMAMGEAQTMSLVEVTEAMVGAQAETELSAAEVRPHRMP